MNWDEIVELLSKCSDLTSRCAMDLVVVTANGPHPFDPHIAFSIDEAFPQNRWLVLRGDEWVMEYP